MRLSAVVIVHMKTLQAIDPARLDDWRDYYNIFDFGQSIIIDGNAHKFEFIDGFH